MFAGYSDLDGTLTGLVVTRSGQSGPTAADAPPSWQVYGPSGPVPNAAGSCLKFAADPGLYIYAIPTHASDGYEMSGAYSLVLRYAVAGVAQLDVRTFLVT